MTKVWPAPDKSGLRAIILSVMGRRALRHSLLKGNGFPLSVNNLPVNGILDWFISTMNYCLVRFLSA